MNKRSSILLGKTMHWELYYNDIESQYTIHNIMTDEYITIEYMDDTYQILDLMEIMRVHEISTQKIVEKEWNERRGEVNWIHGGEGGKTRWV